MVQLVVAGEVAPEQALCALPAGAGTVHGPGSMAQQLCSTHLRSEPAVRKALGEGCCVLVALLEAHSASRPRPMATPLPLSSTYGSWREPGTSQPHTCSRAAQRRGFTQRCGTWPACHSGLSPAAGISCTPPQRPCAWCQCMM